MSDSGGEMITKGNGGTLNDCDWRSSSEEEDGVFVFKSQRFVSKENTHTRHYDYDNSSSDEDDMLLRIKRRKKKQPSSTHKLIALAKKRQKESLKTSQMDRKRNALLTICSSSSESDADPSSSCHERKPPCNNNKNPPIKSKLVELLDSESDSNDENNYTYGKKDLGGSRSMISLGGTSKSKARNTRNSQKALLHGTANTSVNKSEQQNHTDDKTAKLIKKAREAQERLLMAQKYHAEDINLSIDVDDDDDDEVEKIDAIVTSHREKNVPQQSIGPIIKISLRTNIVSKPPELRTMPSIHGTTTVFRISMGEKMQKVMDNYKEKFSSIIGSDSDIKFSFDGEYLTPGQTPNDLDMEDDDLVDVIVKLISIPKISNNKTNNHQKDAGERVTITTRIKGGNRNITHKYQLRKKDAFSKLVQAYRDNHGYSSYRKVGIYYRGKPILDLNSTPDLEDMPDFVDIDIEDETERQKQSASTTSSMIETNYNGLPVSSSSDKKITLKIRRNGADDKTQTYSVNPSDKFQSMVDQYLQANGLKMTECKFIFDGVSLNLNGTPDEEDLEGGEIIDVQVNPTKYHCNPQPRAPKPSTQIIINLDDSDVDPNSPDKSNQNNNNNSRQMTQSIMESFYRVQPSQSTRSNSHSSATNETSLRTVERSVIIVQTYRNNNTQYKPKKFKLYNTDSVLKLKSGYIAYYKSKGCKSVRFYFNNTLVKDETVTFGVLGLQDKGILHAVENNRKYRKK